VLHGNASTIYCASHSAVGCRVTANQSSCRRPWPSSETGAVPADHRFVTATLSTVISSSAAFGRWAFVTGRLRRDRPGNIVRALESVEVNTPVGSLKFQPNGRQALVPLFLGPYEKLATPRYGATYAQRADPFPASKSLPKSAAEYGCKL
jgi:hypothetical protein